MSRACSLHLSNACNHARGTHGLHLRHRIESAVQPPPLAVYRALQLPQFLKRFREMRASFHGRLVICVPFLFSICYTLPTPLQAPADASYPASGPRGLRAATGSLT
jgi:hypothetical protein